MLSVGQLSLSFTELLHCFSGKYINVFTKTLQASYSLVHGSNWLITPYVTILDIELQATNNPQITTGIFIFCCLRPMHLSSGAAN